MILDSSAGHRDPRTSTEGTVVVSEVQGSCSEGAAVDVVLALSLEEEEIRQRVQEADAAIEKLHLLIQSTQEQLQRRKVAREKVILSTRHSLYYVQARCHINLVVYRISPKFCLCFMGYLLHVFHHRNVLTPNRMRAEVIM